MLASGIVEWLGNLDDSVLKLGLLLSFGAVAVGFWAFATAWRRIRLAEQRAVLITQMLQRGMSGEQIARVLLAAEFEPAGKSEDEDETGSNDPEVQIVQHLSANYYEGEDVEKVLAAARVGDTIDPTVVRIVKTLAENWADTDNIVSVLTSRRQHLEEARGGVAAAAGGVAQPRAAG